MAFPGVPGLGRLTALPRDGRPVTRRKASALSNREQRALLRQQAPLAEVLPIGTRRARAAGQGPACPAVQPAGVPAPASDKAAPEGTPTLQQTLLGTTAQPLTRLARSRAAGQATPLAEASAPASVKAAPEGTSTLQQTPLIGLPAQPLTGARRTRAAGLDAQLAEAPMPVGIVAALEGSSAPAKLPDKATRLRPRRAAPRKLPAKPAPARVQRAAQKVTKLTADTSTAKQVTGQPAPGEPPIALQPAPAQDASPSPRADARQPALDEVPAVQLSPAQEACLSPEADAEHSAWRKDLNVQPSPAQDPSPSPDTKAQQPALEEDPIVQLPSAQVVSALQEAEAEAAPQLQANPASQQLPLDSVLPLQVPAASSEPPANMDAFSMVLTPVGIIPAGGAEAPHQAEPEQVTAQKPCTEMAALLRAAPVQHAALAPCDEAIACPVRLKRVPGGDPLQVISCPRCATFLIRPT